jgi:hypothetical protein
MKKIKFIALLLVLNLQGKAQTPEIPELSRNEVKIDAAYFLDRTIKVEYEYLINEWNSVGSVIFHNLKMEPTYQSQILGFYRVYFGDGIANSLFFEGHMGITSGYFGKHNPDNKYTEFGMGIAIGWKMINRRGITLDLFGGWGKTFGGVERDYPRLGLCIGKRFGKRVGTSKFSRGIGVHEDSDFYYYDGN